MDLLRVAYKLPALLAVTVLCAAVPIGVRLVTLGADGPASWVGSRCCMLWCRAAVRILGVRVSVSGGPDGRPFVVASNHVSYLDIWVLGSLYPATFIAKREIAAWPAFGWIAGAAGTLFVDRENARDLVRVARSMSARLRRGISVTLFPEGKATNGSTVLPFMPSLFDSAARLGVPCYAASLSYETPGRRKPPAETICWWARRPFFPHIVELSKIPRIEARVTFAESARQSSNRKELARHLHRDVLESFVPVRDARGE